MGMGESSGLAEKAVQDADQTAGVGEISGAVAAGIASAGASDVLGYVKLRHCCGNNGKVIKMGLIQHGVFSLRDLNPGSYTVETSVPGHAAKFHNVVVNDREPNHLQ